MMASDPLQDRRPFPADRHQLQRFASAVEDLTEHDADAQTKHVRVRIDAEGRTATTLNDLGSLVREYEMAFGSGAVTPGETLLTFVPREDDQADQDAPD